MVDLVYCLTHLSIFNIPSLYYYINLRSLIFCLFSVDIYLSFGIFLSKPIFFVLLSTVSELFCGEILDNFVIISVFYWIKSSVSSAVVWIALF